MSQYLKSRMIWSSNLSRLWPTLLEYMAIKFIPNATKIKAKFPRDRSISNRNNLVRMGLAFPQDRFHLEPMIKNCAGDICLARVQENNRSAEETRQSLFFKLRSLHIWTHLKPFRPFPWVRVQLGPYWKADPV